MRGDEGSSRRALMVWQKYGGREGKGGRQHHLGAWAQEVCAGRPAGLPQDRFLQDLKKKWNGGMTILVGLTLMACLTGCVDTVRLPTAYELAVFRGTGSVTPAVDMDRIEKAKLKTGPYRVVPGDVLEFTMPALLQAVTAAEVQAFTTRSQAENPLMCRVRDDGTITLPAVGPITVAGLSLAQIEAQVTDAYKSYVVLYPSVFLRVAEYKTSKAYIAGAVLRPGVYNLRADQMTLSSLLTEAGGITEVGAAVVRILRGGGQKKDTSPEVLSPESVGEKAAIVPVVSSSGTDEEEPIILPVVNTNIPYRDVSLDEGDTVVVEPVQMPVFSVLGLVARPGNFPYPPTAQYNLTQAIAFAGGLNPVAQPRYATIYRIGTDGIVRRAPFRLIKDGKFTDALSTPIQPGDIVAIEETLRTRMNLLLRDIFRFNTGIYISGRDLWDNN
jgi:protein involved in polysaccharide export with SLBB domain